MSRNDDGFDPPRGANRAAEERAAWVAFAAAAITVAPAVVASGRAPDTIPTAAAQIADHLLDAYRDRFGAA